MVTYTISLEGFTDMIHSISISETGFSLVTFTEGAILAHPVNKYMGFENLKIP